MGYPDSFEGFMVESEKTWSTFNKREFQPKKFEDHDIDIKIECCGVCGSDVHTISGGWGNAKYPVCPGHEIIGHAIKVGPKVKGVKVGDRVGVGAQIWACLECDVCNSGNENYCPKQVDTYNAPYPDGTIAQGGYSSHVRAHEYFVFPIPENIPSEVAAPMLCAGLTTFSPLYRAKVGPGSRVAVIGLGGLGHFGTMWATALGAETYVISHSSSKETDAKKLGAKGFILNIKKDWEKPYAFKFDFILNTADATNTFNLPTYFSILKPNGIFHNVGLPDKPLPELKAFDFMTTGNALQGSHIGNRPECLAMLKLASEKGVRTWVQEIQVGSEGCKEAVERLNKNENVRYRLCLVGYDKVFGLRS